VAEARLEESGSGLAPVTEGWFVVNVRDAEWFSSETRGAACWFESEYGDPPVEFAQLGINVTVLEPGQSGVYHAESNQEAFLVLVGACRLLVEGEERRLRPWDFFHCPPWTEHAFVGAGDRPCVILMVGARLPGSAVPGVGARGALRRERGEGDIRSGAGLCGGRAVPARAAAVLVPPALGLGLQGNIPAPPGMRRRSVHVTFPNAGPRERAEA
jgi:quercetin dioxygenase-like cupin family protein